MLLPLSWLGDFIDLDHTSPEKIAEALTMSGSEVKKIHSQTERFAGIVIAEILAIRPHPNAQKLQLATITTDSKNQYELVCGAPNIHVGQKIPYAPTGAKLGAITVEEKVIRGIASPGMLCSAKELGLSEESSGILILDPSLKLGTPLIKVIPPEIVFELEITPNRPDCLSILGLARELCCVFDKPLKKDSYEQSIPHFKNQARVQITIDAPSACSRYAGLVLSDIGIKPSPLWLQNRLRAAGIRSINNIVDATNYVLWETGQPLHAFDWTKIHDHSIVVRLATKGEKITTLDDQVRTLEPEMLVIADTEKPIALAGIMGGKMSEVDSATTTILLESAHFDAMTVRKASEKLALRTEASARFEKGADRVLVDRALWQAALLIKDLAGGTITAYMDVMTPADKKKLQTQPAVSLPNKEIRRILGVEITKKAAEKTLTRLGFGIKKTTTSKKDWVLSVAIPSFRQDVREKFDLIEEVGRIYGYQRLPATIPSGALAVKNLQIQPDWDTTLREAMVALGFHEVFNYSIISQNTLEDFNLSTDQALKLASPLADFKYVRFSLLPDLLLNVQHNLFNNPNLSTVRLFEYSSVFLSKGNKALPEEPLLLGGVCVESDFLTFKGYLEYVVEKLGISSLSFSSSVLATVPTRAKEVTNMLDARTLTWVFLDSEYVGFLGQVQPLQLQKIGIDRLPKKAVWCFEINADVLKKAARDVRVFKPLSKFPPVLFDCAFILDEHTQSGEVLKALQALSTEAVEIKPELFDVYVGKTIDQGKKSLAFSLQFIPYEQTLNDEHIKQLQEKVVKLVEEKFGGILRDK